MFCTVAVRNNSVVETVKSSLYTHSEPKRSFLPHKVDLTKVKIDVIKPWITRRITEILGFEDDVVIDFCFNLLEKNEVSTSNVV